MSYEFSDLARLENDNKFMKMFELLMLISEKSNEFKNVVKGSYLFI